MTQRSSLQTVGIGIAAPARWQWCYWSFWCLTEIYSCIVICPDVFRHDIDGTNWVIESWIENPKIYIEKNTSGGPKYPNEHHDDGRVVTRALWRVMRAPSRATAIGLTSLRAYPPIFPGSYNAMTFWALILESIGFERVTQAYGVHATLGIVFKKSHLLIEIQHKYWMG